MSKKNQGKLILLSAVLPNIEDFGLWVGGNETSNTKSDWRPSSQRLGSLFFGDNSVDIEWQGEIPSFNKNFILKKNY